MAKAKENIKDLKNISTFGYGKLTMWGMIGSLIILALAIVSIAVWDVAVLGTIFRWVAFGFGILYAVLGVFGIVKVVQSQEGKFWVLFLVAAIFAVLTPLTAITAGIGIGFSTVAGILFLVFYLLEKK